MATSGIQLLPRTESISIITKLIHPGLPKTRHSTWLMTNKARGPQMEAKDDVPLKSISSSVSCTGQAYGGKASPYPSELPQLLLRTFLSTSLSEPSELRLQ